MKVVSLFCLALFGCALNIMIETDATVEIEGSDREFTEEIKKRVVNGWNAEIHNFPWQVSLRWKRSNHHKCGGSLIGRRWVLTAAHCVKNRNPSKYVVVVGTETRFTKTRGQIIYRVKKLFPHGFYNARNHKNDIALLWLAEAVELSRNIKTIKLPRQSHKVAINTRCYLTGWGRTSGGGERPNDLQYATLYTVGYDICKKKSHYRHLDKHVMLCAGGKREKAGACNGDSGGPLACREKHRWILRGVVSFGKKGCNRHRHSVFARVSSYVDWIKCVMRKKNGRKCDNVF